MSSIIQYFKTRNRKDLSKITNLRSSKHPITDVITSCTSSRQCTWELPGLDDCSTTLLNGANKLSIQPSMEKQHILLLKILLFKLRDRDILQKLYHASSATSSRTDFSSPDDNLTVAWLTSGYCVDEWLPQIITFLTSDTWTFNLSEIWPNALLWSNLVKQEIFLSGMEGANSFKISALVFAGLATTKTWKSKDTKSQCLIFRT